MTEPKLSDRVLQDIRRIAARRGVDKVILFGSRARGDNGDRSDIDLAVSGGDIGEFSLDVEEECWTLLEFDVINLDEPLQEKLLREIDRDGVALYERV